MIRKINSFLGLGLVVLLLYHAITGAFQLMGIMTGGSQVRKFISWVMMVFFVAHGAIGIKLTIDSIRLYRKNGALYLRENRVFWIRRISGFAMIFLVVDHILLFMGVGAEPQRLPYFGPARLASSLLLVLAICVHLVSNIRPLMVAFGEGRFRRFVIDILFIMSIVMFFCAVAFIFYYLRWTLLWRV